MRPILVLDAYLDERGGAHNFERLLAGRALHSVRLVHGEVPRDVRDYSGVLVSGSAASVLEPPPWLEPAAALLRRALQHGRPVLGICFGHQLLAEAAFGPGSVRRAAWSELGWVDVERVDADPLLDALPRRFTCFASHFDEVRELEGGMRVLARSARCAVEAFRVDGAAAWGVQFHPEMEGPECEQLVRASLERHAHLPQEPATVLARASDASLLGHALLSRFVELCRDGVGSAPRPELGTRP